MIEELFFPCPICQGLRNVEITKNKKPYIKCNDCGVQLFVRGKEGIRKMGEIVGARKIKGDSQQLIKRLDLFNILKERLKEIENEQPFLGTNSDLDLQEKAIKNQLAKLRSNMKKQESS